MYKLITLILGALILVAVVWNFLRPPAAPTEVRHIGIGTFSNAIDYGPAYVARSFGWFEEELKEINGGLTTYVEYGSFEEIETALTEGELHALFSAAVPVIRLVSNGNSLKIFANGCTLQQDILVRTDRQINSVSELKGKDIAVAEGTSSHYGLAKILSTASLDLSDITLRPGFPGDAVLLFEDGDVDAWAVWPPHVEKQLIKGKGKLLAGGEAKIQSVMSLSEKNVTNDETKQALTNAINRAKIWMVLNPDEAQTIVSQAIGEDKAVVALAWPKHNWGATIDEKVIKDIQEKSIFMKSAGVITSNVTPSIEDLVDKNLLSQ